jgi:Prokaryotic cytochrome b561
MSRRPYQPLPFRILHNIHSLLIVAALVTGFWVYNTFDGRFGSLPLPNLPDMIGIHGTFGLSFFLVMPFFALYSFHVGSHRLIQADSLEHLQDSTTPLGKLSAQQLVNTAMLLAATLSAVSGRMMKEEWLPAGQLNHGWYLLHLLGWLVMLLGLIAHVVMALRLGGTPLVASLASVKVRAADRAIKPQPTRGLLRGVEIVVIIGLIFALVAPLLAS